MTKVKVGDHWADLFYDKVTKQYILGASIETRLVYVPVCLISTIQKLKEAIDDVHRTQSH